MATKNVNGGNGRPPWYPYYYPWYKGYPRKGWDFPRRYQDVTPQEYLFDPTRVLGGRDTSCQIARTERMGVRQPRVESSYLIQECRNVRPYVPPTEMLIARRMPHLDLSRDAEVFYNINCVDLDPLETGTVITMNTIANHITIFRWIGAHYFDGIQPIGANWLFRVLVDSSPVKFFITGPIGMGATDGTSGSSAGAVMTSEWFQLWGLPESFHNVLYESVDHRTIQIQARNLDEYATRKIGVGVWGWVEPQTRFSEATFH